MSQKNESLGNITDDKYLHFEFSPHPPKIGGVAE